MRPPIATPARFIQDALENGNNRAILQRLPALALPDAWLVAGCLFQTVWNLRSGHAPERGIKDYDLFYCDATDLPAVRAPPLFEKKALSYQSRWPSLRIDP